MGASSQDRKIRFRVQKRKWRIEVEVNILNFYSTEVGERIAADKELQRRDYLRELRSVSILICLDRKLSVESFRAGSPRVDLHGFLLFASRSARFRSRIYAPTAPDLRIRPLARSILGCVCRT